MTEGSYTATMTGNEDTENVTTSYDEELLASGTDKTETSTVTTSEASSTELYAGAGDDME